MRVICPFCSNKALITSTNALNEQRTVTDLYCLCPNTECSATFVFTLGYKHVLNPPAKKVTEMAANLIRNMSKEDKADLLLQLK